MTKLIQVIRGTFLIYKRGRAKWLKKQCPHVSTSAEDGSNGIFASKLLLMGTLNQPVVKNLAYILRWKCVLLGPAKQSKFRKMIIKISKLATLRVKGAVCKYLTALTPSCLCFVHMSFIGTGKSNFSWSRFDKAKFVNKGNSYDFMANTVKSSTYSLE